jgi:hypothetical protein
MTFILWRQGASGVEQYVTDWADKGGNAAFSTNRAEALKYQTRAAAEAAVAGRAPAGWQIREVGEPG